MIDIHAHILPGVDDGAKNWDQTLQMARLAVEDGITVMVATPHLYQRENYRPESIKYQRNNPPARGATER